MASRESGTELCTAKKSLNYLHRLTVIIPTKNEERAIGRVIEELVETGIPVEKIIVVDGHSSDRTREIAEKMGVKVVLQEGEGKAMAIKTGLKHVGTEYVAIMDGDYTYPGYCIPALLSKIVEEGYDMVIGARVPERGSQGAIYRLGNWGLTKLFNLLFGTKLRDVLSGMYVVKAKRLREVLFEMPHFSVESEIAAHIASTSGKIVEVEIPYRRRIGEKKLGVFHGISIARDMIRLAWRYNPTFFVFFAGSLLLIPGVALGAWVAYNYFFVGVKYYLKGLVAIILVAGGFFSVLQAIMALYAKRAEHRIQQQIEDLKTLVERLLEEKVRKKEKAKRTS